MMLGTLMLPYHVTLIPQYVLFLKLDWVDTFLPLVVPKFLAVDAFFIFLMVQFFRGIPRELDEAAMIDGCGPWRIYWRIILPLSMPAARDGGDLLLHLDLGRLLRPARSISTTSAHYTVPLGAAQLRRLDRQVRLGRAVRDVRRWRWSRSSCSSSSSSV